MSQQFVLLSDKITNHSFKNTCDERKIESNKTVFIFPGNADHHKEENKPSLYSEKRGGGLAGVAEQLAKIGVPTLSLPTTDMLNNLEQEQIRKRAVLDLWKAAGNGMSFILPVRNRNEKGKFFSEALATEQEQEQQKQQEPSFWGKNETTPNLELADYYLKEIEKLRDFIALKDEQQQSAMLENLDKDIQSAFNEGREAIDKPTPWFQPTATGQRNTNAQSNTATGQPALTITTPPEQKKGLLPSPSNRLLGQNPIGFIAALAKWKSEGECQDYTIQDNKVLKNNTELLAIAEQTMTFITPNDDAYQAAANIINHAKQTCLQISGGTPTERTQLLTVLAKSKDPNLQITLIDEENRKLTLTGVAAINQHLGLLPAAETTSRSSLGPKR